MIQSLDRNRMGPEIPQTDFDKSFKAAKDFESFFVGYVFQTAFQSIPKSEMMDGGMGNEIYQGMFVEQVTQKAVEGKGLGLAEQLTRGMSLSPAPATPQGRLRPSSSSEDHKLFGILDVPSTKMSSDFGMRTHPLRGNKQFHEGIDLALPMGSPIKVAAEGTVVFSGEKGGYGNAVIVRHEGGLTTLYGHASKNLVKEGDKVMQGQVIGLTGNSGKSTGPHLHFEVRQEGLAVDPKNYVSFEKRV